MSELMLRASEWCYRGIWGGLTRWLKVPDTPPSLPAQDPTVVRSFRPSEAYLNYRKFFFWIGLLVMDFGFTVAWIAIGFASPVIGILITPLALAIIVLPDIVAYIVIHLRYDTTWYVLTDRSMRIRRGIWKICETTITFENIQNIRLSQGPLQRYFGFANVVVETAGGGGSQGEHGGMSAHVGVLEGLANAAEVRDLILARLKSCRNSGLGDERSQSKLLARREGMSERERNVLREIRALTKELAERGV